MVDPVSIGASMLASSTVKYFVGKGKRMHFLNEAVENAASQVAEGHDGLNPDVFIAIFEDDRVINLVEEFEDGGDLITPSDIAETFDEDMLGPEVEATPEELVTEFLDRLEVEISQDPKLGRKLRMEYTQRIHQYTEELGEGQEEILFQIQRIAGRLPTDKKYEVFQPIPARFHRELSGEQPQDRYDLPFFGREENVDHVIQFPESDEDVLIFSGRAGIGKTRLVVEGSLLLEAENPDWQVYWTDIHAGNIDEGLEEIELRDGRNTVLFVDDARNAEQVERLFDLTDQYQSQLKLIFAERPYFISALKGHANRFKNLEAEFVDLDPLNSDDVHSILQEYYGITHPQTLERITAISEGLPLFAHLLAEQFSDGDRDPVSQNETLEAVFEDVLSDIQKLAEQQGVGNPQKLETYVKYLAAIGELDTTNEEFLQQFCEAISIDTATEIEFREILTENIGLLTGHASRLTIQPDALQEYVVYNSFFSDSPRNYQDEIYSKFSEYSGDTQINHLAIIHRRYNCREARKIIRDILNTEMGRMDEYGFAKRVRLLRRFEILGATHPHHAIELVKSALREKLPDNPEKEPLARSSAYTASPAGDLLIESINVLSNALRGEPEEATEWLLWIAVNYPVQSQLRTSSVNQKLRDEMRPGFQKSPRGQQKILSQLGEYLLSGELDEQLRLDLLDVIGEVSSTSIHDFSLDPIDRSQMRSWQGVVPITEPWIDLRNQAIELLTEVIRGDPHPEIRKTAAEKLVGFESEQSRYYNDHGDVFCHEELVRIFEFATEYVADDENLQCIDILSSMAERESPDELEIGDEVEALALALEDNDRYQLLQRMRSRAPKKLEEREAEIRVFAKEIDEADFEPSDIADVVSEITNTSFNQFFSVLADERPDLGEKLLEENSSNLRSSLPSVIIGICSADPERGKELVDQYIEEHRFDLVSAGLRALVGKDLDFVQDKVDVLLESQSPISAELVSGLSNVVMGCWEDNTEWTETVLLNLLEDAESLDAQQVDAVLRPLPLHRDDSRQIDEEILIEVLDYLKGQENLASESHSIEYVIAEIAERDPERFVDFCLQRLENGFTGISLLPSHLDIDTDRMKKADGYDDAVERVCERVLDTDYYPPIAFTDLTGSFPIADVSGCLLPRIPDCSEDELLQIIWYCKQLPITEQIEEVYLSILTEGVDDIRQSESVQSVLHSALYTDSLTLGVGVDMKEDEIEMLRRWQKDTSLPFSVRWFAEEAEDRLLESLERREDMFRE